MTAPHTLMVATVREGIDWARVCLPPCTSGVVDRIETNIRWGPVMRANLSYAYYCPLLSIPDPEHSGREMRIANCQVVVVASADKTVITTWHDRADQFCTRLDDGAGERYPVVEDGDPATYDEVLARLAAEGAEVGRHRWKAHHSVRTPSRQTVYLPADPVAGDDVAADVALLRRFGCLLRSI